MSPRAAAYVGGAVVLGVLSGVLGAVLTRLLFGRSGLGDSSLPTVVLVGVFSVLGLVQVALPVVASVATRLPFAGLGTAAVVAAVVTAVQPLIIGARSGFGVREVAFVAFLVLTLLVVDLTVLRFAGRGLPLGAVLGAVVVMAVLRIALTLARFASYDGLALRALLSTPSSVVDLLVVGPVGLVLAGLLGWVLRPRSRRVLAAG